MPILCPECGKLNNKQENQERARCESCSGLLWLPELIEEVVEYKESDFKRLDTKELMESVMDLLKDKEFKDGFVKMTGFSIPEPYDNLGDYIDSMSIYSNNEIISKLYIDLGKLHSSVDSKAYKHKFLRFLRGPKNNEAIEIFKRGRTSFPTTREIRGY